tara:strand:- start:1874 stop:2323 length:450 start_codon:yes stop_codon:yes gene_type:complete
MPKLTVREQEALTQTIIDRIQNVEIQNAKADFKLIEKDINEIKSRYQHLENQKTDIINKLDSLEKQFNKLIDKFNKDKQFVEYQKINHQYGVPYVLQEWGLCATDNYLIKDNISRDVIVSALKTNEDMEQIIVDLVYNYLPKTKLKVAS